MAHRAVIFATAQLSCLFCCAVTPYCAAFIMLLNKLKLIELLILIKIESTNSTTTLLVVFRHAISEIELNSIITYHREEAGAEMRIDLINPFSAPFPLLPTSASVLFSSAVFTARCTLVQSAVLLSYVVRLSVRLSVCP